MREYTECYIAVLDLLGFKSALDNNDCEGIASIFDEIKQNYFIKYDATGKAIVDNNAIHIKIMSDTICIYIDSSIKNSLTALVATCDYLMIRLLRLSIPILSRGAIVKGQIYHEEDILFGPGFVDAYYLEENEVNYPRIIIDETALKEYTLYNEAGQKYLEQNIIKDSYDGKYISDYLYIFYGLNHEQNTWKQFACYVINKAKNETNERIKQKYLYLSSNFNRIAQKYIKEYSDVRTNHNNNI